MAGTKTGTSTIIRLVRNICRIAGTYGAGDLASRTSASYAAAVFALVAACNIFEALDDYPAEIDATAPYGPEDQIPV